MRGVLFECPALRALRCVCHALRCVALCCAAWWWWNCCREKGPITSIITGSSSQYNQAILSACDLDVEGHAQGSNAPPSICSTHQLSSMQQGNKYVRHKPSLSFIWTPFMRTTLIIYCSCHPQPNHENSMEVILKLYIYCFHPLPLCICSMWFKTPPCIISIRSTSTSTSTSTSPVFL